MFDSTFEYASFVAGDNIVLTMRIDERKVAPKAFRTTISVCDWGIVAGIRQDTSLASRLERGKGGEASNDFCEHFV